MTILKTLNEITSHELLLDACDEKGVHSLNIPFKVYNGTILRREAIKWVKTLKVNNLMKYNKFSTGRTYTEIEGAIEFIKHFFNLTEDDLK